MPALFGIVLIFADVWDVGVQDVVAAHMLAGRIFGCKMLLRVV